MILFIRDSKTSTRKFLEIINDFSNVLDKSQLSKKSVDFLYTNEKDPEKEIMDTHS